MDLNEWGKIEKRDIKKENGERKRKGDDEYERANERKKKRYRKKVR